MKLISRKGTFEVDDFEVNRTLDIVFSADTLIMKAKKDKENENLDELKVDADHIEVKGLIPTASMIRIPVELEDAPEGKEIYLKIFIVMYMAINRCCQIKKCQVFDKFYILFNNFSESFKS